MPLGRNLYFKSICLGRTVFEQGLLEFVGKGLG
jgi:hypothetical protein